MVAAPLPEFPGCRVLARVRSGPVADYFHAVQHPLGRPVLVKALSPSILPSSPFAAALEREARVLGALHHPGLITLHDFVRTDDRMWLILEWVDGWTLEELLGRLHQLDPAEAAVVGLRAAEALAHAHQRGVVHRDLRPRNLMLSRTGEVKLLEFSVAVDAGEGGLPELLDSTGHLGAPAYLSPEQILGEAFEPRSDLFSLGVVLFELIRGERPFTGPDDRAVTQRIRHDPAPPLSRGLSGVPVSLDRVVQRLLQKLPQERFADADELCRALGAVLDELGRGDGREVLEALAARVTEARPASAPRGAPVALRERSPLARLVGGLAVAGALVLGGALGLRVLDPEGARQARARTPALGLVPEQRAWLRVLATPWAHVSIDGERIETTPFAQPIPLSPGRHRVLLEHPQAPPERREITLAAGETVLLDVQLEVPGLAGGAAVDAAPLDAGADSP